MTIPLESICIMRTGIESQTFFRNDPEGAVARRAERERREADTPLANFLALFEAYRALGRYG
jgi:hypothetical protein